MTQLELITFPFALYGLKVLCFQLYESYLSWTASRSRNQLYSFLLNYYQIIIWGPAGSGKTLLLSILANHPQNPYAKYTNFPSFSQNVHDSLSWSDLTMKNNLPKQSWLFLDEVGLYGNWTDPKTERKQNEDVALFLQFVRHCQHRLFVATQRLGGGIWNEMRDRSALFIQMTGFQKYNSFTLLTFQTSLNERMEHPSFWRIPVTQSDYELYESTWMSPRNITVSSSEKSLLSGVNETRERVS